MKIALPMDNNDLNSDICISFGRAPLFVIFNTDNEKTVFLYNKGAESSGGAGIKTAQLLVDNDVDACISHKMGENAAEVLYSANIIVYKCVEGSAAYNIQEYKNGRLELLKKTHKGYHGVGEIR